MNIWTFLQRRWLDFMIFFITCFNCFHYCFWRFSGKKNFIFFLLYRSKGIKLKYMELSVDQLVKVDECKYWLKANYQPLPPDVSSAMWVSFAPVESLEANPVTFSWKSFASVVGTVSSPPLTSSASADSWKTFLESIAFVLSSSAFVQTTIINSLEEHLFRQSQN